MNTNLFHYVFHFNDHTGLWSMIERNHYNEYWNEYDHPYVKRDADLNVLIQFAKENPLPIYDNQEKSKKA